MLLRDVPYTIIGLYILCNGNAASIAVVISFFVCSVMTGMKTARFGSFPKDKRAFDFEKYAFSLVSASVVTSTQLDTDADAGLFDATPYGRPLSYDQLCEEVG